MTLQLILLTETLSAEAALELVDLVVENLDVLLEIRVAVEGRSAELAGVAVFVTLRIMLEKGKTF